MTAKQWLDENNICEQTYYHWLKRIRQETYELATNSANTSCVKTMHGEQKKKELFAAVEKSSKSYEEIMEFLTAKNE